MRSSSFVFLIGSFGLATLGACTADPSAAEPALDAGPDAAASPQPSTPDASAPAADAGSLYATYTESTYLEFVNAPAPGQPIETPPQLQLSLGGEPFAVTMDTGSTGIVVSASRIPGFANLPGPAGSLTYSSSGRIMQGRWVTIAATVQGAGGTSLTTSPLRVLGITQVQCTPNARNCTEEDAPTSVAMMGVGFGREADEQPQSTPDTNPFLNVAGTSSAHRRGYVLSARGIHVGITADNSAGELRSIALEPYPDVAGDWLGVPVCISVDDNAAACGRSLIDTGVSTMYLTMPSAGVSGAVDGGGDLVNGTHLRFAFPDEGAAGASYELVLGQNSPTAPDKVVLNTTRPQPYVNTSVRFLNAFDVMYDADGGRYGIRPHTAP